MEELDFVMLSEQECKADHTCRPCAASVRSQAFKGMLAAISFNAPCKFCHMKTVVEDTLIFVNFQASEQVTGLRKD